jgi:hypothetical protein
VVTTANRTEPQAADLGALLGREALGFLQNHPRQSLLLSFCSGLAAGASPGLRKTLRELF